MEPLGALIYEHISDLRREAEAAQLASAAIAARNYESRLRAPSGALRWVSSGLLFVAMRLDPSLHRPTYGRE